MVNDFGPIEYGNARKINGVSLPVLPLAILRYRAIAEFYSEEPMNMRIKMDEDDGDLIELEQVLRIRNWIPNTKLVSWLIYSENREWKNDFGESSPIIIRKIVWEQNKDIERIRAGKSLKNKKLPSWPTLSIKNKFIDSDKSQRLVEILTDFDKKINKGFNLHKRDKSRETSWSDVELMRRFNWGQIHFTWDNSLHNQIIEDFSFLLNDQLEELLNLTSSDIYQMDLDYSYPPEKFKALIEGKNI